MMILFPKNLKYLRLLHGLSQEDLAIETGLNRGNIASYEKGVAEPKLQNLQKIGHFFQISLDELIGIDLEIAEKVEKIEQDTLLEKLLENALEYHQMAEGFDSYYKWRCEQKEKGNVTQLTDISSEYIKLLSVMKHLIQHHFEVLEAFRASRNS